MAHQADSESVPSLESLAANLSLSDAESVADLEETTVSKKIDRLSLLPNELLDNIFDLAYTLDNPPTGPLSKRLLHWYETGLYTRIQLPKESNVIKLMAKILLEPDKGKLVKSLDLAQRPPTTSDHLCGREEPRRFFENLPRLEEFRYGTDYRDGIFYDCFHFGPSPISPQVLPCLSHLQFPNIFSFETLVSHKSLKSLELVDFNTAWHSPNVDKCEPLLRLTSLTVTGLAARDPKIALLVSICPRISHLRLVSSAYHPAFDSLLTLLPTTLTSLELIQHKSGHSHLEICNNVLPRFAQLKHLVLRTAICSHDLMTDLLSLTQLTSLELRVLFIPPEPLLELVSGPNRLRHLQHLKLDTDLGPIGSRITLDEYGNVDPRFHLPMEIGEVCEDWHKRKFAGYILEDLKYTLSTFRRIIQRLRATGTEVEGNVPETLEVANAFLLEIRNLTIYRCYKDQTLQHLTTLQTSCPGYSGRIRTLDLDSLDPTKLVLVKEDLPDEGWFALSLKN